MYACIYRTPWWTSHRLKGHFLSKVKFISIYLIVIYLSFRRIFISPTVQEGGRLLGFFLSELKWFLYLEIQQIVSIREELFD